MSPPTLFRCALHCLCPRCGKGKIFGRYLTVKKDCGECGLHLAQEDVADGPAVLLIFLWGFLIVPLALWFEFRLSPPLWLHIALWPFVMLIGTLLLLPPLRALTLAIQYKNGILKGKDDAA